MSGNKEFVVTAYIIDDEQRILLVHHRKNGFWVPPGGHIEPGETPVEAIHRETLEETGLEIEIITQENIWINNSEATSFERPFLCLLEQIPAHNNHPAHQHMDLVYLARPKSSQITFNEKETLGIRWFTPEEALSLKPGIETFSDCLEVLKHIFFKVLPIQVK